MADRVIVNHKANVAYIKLSYLAQLNVLDIEGWRSLREIMDEVSQNGEVNCVVIEGEGEKAFSAGSDIKSFLGERNTEDQVREYAGALEGALSALVNCPHPTVALISGICVGGGLEIAACCDLRICGEGSRFGAPINRLGLTMSYTELGPIVRLIGASRTLEILFGGRLITAQRAYDIGLVTTVVPDGTVREEVESTVERIGSGAPLVNRWHKKFVRNLVDMVDLTPEMKEEAYEAFQTEDYKEGIQ
ncbi:MAG TPA: enoyl-CoA hydratase/isomerase family protein, partial [Gemmatimonadetes bacterium]|nr:enoyl-CoA hydratase/isomerase family protein [Gemmatimonadota bacterium]